MSSFQSLRPRNPALPQIHRNFSGDKFVCYLINNPDPLAISVGFGPTHREAWEDWAIKEAARK